MSVYREHLKKIVILLVSSVICGQAFANCNLPKLAEMTALIGQRASIMKSVAANKWYFSPNHQPSPYNAAEEINILASTRDSAKQLKIDALSLMVFSQVQMDLSKHIEAYWINRWNKHDTPAQAKPTKATLKSLASLRKKIIAIDNKLFPSIQSAIPYIQQCTTKQLQPSFRHTFAKVAGMPSQVDFVGVLIKTLRQVVPAHHLSPRI